MYPRGPPRRPSLINAGAPAQMFHHPPPPPYYAPIVNPHAGLPLPYAPAVPYHGAVAPAPIFGHPAVQEVQLRPVNATNVDAALNVISALLPSYPYLFVDAEYPGIVHRPGDGRLEDELSPDERYALVKKNVDDVPIVQLGLTLCDAQGTVPLASVDRGAGGYPRAVGPAWEVTFRDFDDSRDPHVRASVEFLRENGVDFASAREGGVGSVAFGRKLDRVIASAARRGVRLKWVAFGGAYDFAYLVKLLSGGRPLPETRGDFFLWAWSFLRGGWMFDAKFMAANCGRDELRGLGLTRVAQGLGVASLPAPLLAGHKSITTYRIHAILRRHLLSQDEEDEDDATYRGCVDGLVAQFPWPHHHAGH